MHPNLDHPDFYPGDMSPNPAWGQTAYGLGINCA